MFTFGTAGRKMHGIYYGGRMKRIIVLTLAALAAGSAYADGKDLAELVPANSLAVLSVRDTGNLRRQMAETPYFKVLADPALDAGRERIADFFQTRFERIPLFIGLRLDETLAALNGQTVFAARRKRAGALRIGLEFVLLVDLGDGRTAFEERLEAAVKKSIREALIERAAYDAEGVMAFTLYDLKRQIDRPRPEQRALDYADDKVRRELDEEVPDKKSDGYEIVYGFVGNVFIAASTRVYFRDTVRLASGKSDGASIVKTRPYAEAAEKFPGAENFFFVQLSAAMADLLKYFPHLKILGLNERPAADAKDAPNDKENGSVAERLGLNGLAWAAGRFDFRDGLMAREIFVRTAMPRRLLLSLADCLQGPVALGEIPERAVRTITLRVDPTKVFETARRVMLDGWGADCAGLRALDEAENRLGTSTADFLSAFDGALALSRFANGDWIFSAGLNRNAPVLAGLAAFFAFANGELRPDTTVTADSPVSPLSFRVGQNVVFVSNSARLIDEYVSGGPPRLKTRPEALAAVEKIAGGGGLVVTGSLLHDFLQKARPSAGGMLAELGELGLLPSDDVIGKYLNVREIAAFTAGADGLLVKIGHFRNDRR